MSKKPRTKWFYKDFTGVTASITLRSDGKARLVVRNQLGQVIKDAIYKNQRSAYVTWNHMCN